MKSRESAGRAAAVKRDIQRPAGPRRRWPLQEFALAKRESCLRLTVEF